MFSHLCEGDCYFCAEPDNSIINRGCWCTHFTSARKGEGVSRSECVFHVSMCAPECCTAADMPRRADGKRRGGKKEKGAVTNMAIREIRLGR